MWCIRLHMAAGRRCFAIWGQERSFWLIERASRGIMEVPEDDYAA